MTLLPVSKPNRSAQISSRWLKLLGLALALAGCAKVRPERAGDSRPASSAAFPLSVVDDGGRRVTLPQEPRRIISLLPSFTETIFALGVGERVVGVDDFSDYPGEVVRLPRLGGEYDTQLERILALKPDLVLLSGDSRAAAALASNGVNVFGASPRKLPDVFRVIERTGELVGRKAEAVALTARMRAALAELENRVKDAPRVSVYYELDPTPYSVGPDSFIGVMIQKAGGQDIVPANLGDFPKLSPELVIAQNPSVIIGATLEEVRSRPGWSRIAAVQSGRVSKWAAAEDHLMSRPGPRLAQALRALIAKLHPELSP